MNYTYDIYINLNTILYDFFDWNKNDKIAHVKKMPIYKVSEYNILKLIHYNVRIDTDFLNKIYNKTQLWDNGNNIKYCCLFCDDNNVIAIEFNHHGKSIKKSYLSVDDELETLETINKISDKKIEFMILNKCINLLNTRNELKQKNFIDNELNNIEIKKLDYIYFECFGKHEKNKKCIIKKIKKLSNTSETYKSLYNILKLTSTTKK